VGLNEAQLINPQSTNKNMATKNKYWEVLKNEWINGGRVVYNTDKIVIEKNGEWLIQLNDVIIHIVPGKMVAVKMNGRWYASHAPAWRGKALMIIRQLRPKLPSMVPLPP